MVPVMTVPTHRLPPMAPSPVGHVILIDALKGQASFPTLCCESDWGIECRAVDPLRAPSQMPALPYMPETGHAAPDSRIVTPVGPTHAVESERYSANVCAWMEASLCRR